eukprot:TRINITY_DN7446_c0_g1_i3.p1 TRINITY_DN7446_c0_g1~~TRINITY_DN7446_c0_g1_i3.p1  ORF type:complete len:247 (+),score=62.05 TRINITY_DN7446_c0_g1_i3:171-911(+)
MWAKLNPGIAYVQGMNEILGPIYYVFANDKDTDTRDHAEEDAFFCFKNLMSEIMNNFCKSLDSSPVGIQQKMKDLNTLLQHKDPELWLNLEDKQLNPQFYSFRWLTLLLSQEFELPDVIRLWDTLFSDENRFDHLLYICVSMLVYQREKLLEGDFAENLKLLQTYPPTDLTELLSLAKEIKDPNYTPPSTHTPNNTTTSIASTIISFATDAAGIGHNNNHNNNNNNNSNNQEKSKASTFFSAILDV